MRSLIWLALAAITLGEETCGDEFTKVEWGGGSMCVALMGSGSFDECEKDVCQAAGGHLACFSSDDEYRAVYEALLHDLKGGWPHGCAFFGLHHCDSDEGEWEWTTSTCSTEFDFPWANGEPNDYAGSEDCGMVCPEYSSTGDAWNDGPCHNKISCLCQEASEATVLNYSSNTCPEAHWAGWIALSFLLSFAWWFAAVFGCTGLGQFTHHPKLKCALTLAIIVNCLMTMILWHGLVNPIYGSNELVGLMGVLGLPSGVIVAFVFSRVVLPRLIARARIQREETVRMAAQARDEELCVELAARSGEMTVHVNLLDGNRIPIDVDRSDTIDTLRRKIHGKAGLNHECQRLLHNGNELNDGTVGSHGLEPNATLHLIVVSPEGTVPPLAHCVVVGSTEKY